ncbi:MAG: hypothetical protein KDA44_22455 [Planctomycetales bacterium]|nr:hypothetical protein [Planctomycetales bacterium]
MKAQRCPSQAERLGALSVPQVARRWHTTRRRVRRLLQAGRLPFVEINGEIRVPLAVVRGREAT